MRVLIAAMFGLALTGGAAWAAPWNDPNGRMAFDAPAGWTTTVEHSADYTYVVTGTASNECHLVSRPNPSTASASADAVRRAAANDAQFDEAQWMSVASGMTSVFGNNSAAFVSRSTDSGGFWPIQRAEMRSGDRAVHAALQLRPGLDLVALCMTYDGANSTEMYDAVIRSMGHPNDATFQAEAEHVAAENAAANAAADAQNAQTQEGNDRDARRRRVQH